MTTFASTGSWLAETKALLQLAAPLIVNSLSIAGMQFADAVMAGQLGARALAAVAVGASVWFLGFRGMLGADDGDLADRGAALWRRRIQLIGRYTRQGLMLGVLLGVIFIILAWLFVEPALTFVGRRRRVSRHHDRLRARDHPGCARDLRVPGLRFTTEGIGYTRPIMYMSLFGLVCNVFLNYVFMYGRYGAPAMGAVGCGVASAITMWLMMIILGTYMMLHPRYRPLKIFKRVPHLRLPILKEILLLGVPIAVTITAESGLFSAVSILIGTLGAEITAAHQIAINFASTMFMVPLALSAATTIRIGHALGAGNPAAARFSGITGISVCAAFMACSAAFMLLFRDAVVGLYTNDPAVRTIAISLLLMAAIFQIADGTQVGAAGALRGYKDTRVPMVITTFAYWVLAFPLAWLAAITFRKPPEYIWGGFVLGLSVAALLLTFRYRRVSRDALSQPL